MAGKYKRRKEVRLTARRSLLDMEDDLRILQGTLKALTMIGVCQDEIYPEALDVLVRFGGEALDRLQAKWLAARDEAPGLAGSQE